MAQGDANAMLDRLVIRTYRQEDQPEVSRLFTDGLLAGQIAPNDTGADIENIREAYFDNPRNHLWVAELDDQLVGMIGVAEEQQHTAEIRRLRVRPDLQHAPIASRLIETALSHCKHHGYLKVVLDTRCESTSAAVDVFHRLGFQHTRTKPAQAKELLEFYLDLYREPRRSHEHD